MKATDVFVSPSDDKNVSLRFFGKRIDKNQPAEQIAIDLPWSEAHRLVNEILKLYGMYGVEVAGDE